MRALVLAGILGCMTGCLTMKLDHATADCAAGDIDACSRKGAYLYASGRGPEGYPILNEICFDKQYMSACRLFHEYAPYDFRKAEDAFITSICSKRVAEVGGSVPDCIAYIRERETAARSARPPAPVVQAGPPSNAGLQDLSNQIRLNELERQQRIDRCMQQNQNARVQMPCM